MFFRNKGFKVKLHGRSQIEYIEGKKRLLIESEFLAGDIGIVIYSNNQIRWNPPYENDLLGADDIERIKNNVLSDLAEHKIKAEWS